MALYALLAAYALAVLACTWLALALQARMRHATAHRMRCQLALQAWARCVRAHHTRTQRAKGVLPYPAS